MKISKIGIISGKGGTGKTTPATIPSRSEDVAKLLDRALKTEGLS